LQELVEAGGNLTRITFNNESTQLSSDSSLFQLCCELSLDVSVEAIIMQITMLCIKNEIQEPLQFFRLVATNIGSCHGDNISLLTELPSRPWLAQEDLKLNMDVALAIAELLDSSSLISYKL